MALFICQCQEIDRDGGGMGCCNQESTSFVQQFTDAPHNNFLKISLQNYPSHPSSVFIVNFEHISYLFLVFLLFTLNKQILAGTVMLLVHYSRHVDSEIFNLFRKLFGTDSLSFLLELANIPTIQLKRRLYSQKSYQINLSCMLCCVMNCGACCVSVLRMLYLTVWFGMTNNLYVWV